MYWYRLGKLLMVWMACSLLLVTTAIAQTHTVIQIAAEQGRDPKPNDKGDAVWWRLEGVHPNWLTPIVFYDASLKTITQLPDTEQSGWYCRPACRSAGWYFINNHSDVGWDGPWGVPGEDAEIFLRDPSTGSVYTITSNDVDDGIYRVTEDRRVLYVSKVPDPNQVNAYSYELYSYDIAAQTTAWLGGFTQFAQWPADVSARGDVLWEVRDPNYRNQLWLYSAARMVTTLISPANTTSYDPSLNDSGNLAFREFRAADHAIRLYDDASGQLEELMSAPINAVWEPVVSNGGNVVWTGGPDRACGSAYDVHYYDASQGANGRVTRLTDTSSPDYCFWGMWDKDINDAGDAVWIDWNPRPTGRELNVYLHSLDRIVTIGGVQDPDWPQVSRLTNIAFEGGPRDSRGVFMAVRLTGSLRALIDGHVSSGQLGSQLAEDLIRTVDSVDEALAAGDRDRADRSISEFAESVDKEHKKGNISDLVAQEFQQAASSLRAQI